MYKFIKRDFNSKRLGGSDEHRGNYNEAGYTLAVIITYYRKTYCYLLKC
mgnify:CR=1 FL=1